jgi:hypothetical protein
MSVKANTFGVGVATNITAAVGGREDLTDVIYNISPTETPFMSNIGRTKCSATTHEWQTDSLASAAANQQLEGEDYDSAGLSASVVTTRATNYTTISAKTLIISGTHESTLKAGRKSEIAYQVAKKGKELKRDIEFTLCQQQADVASTGTTTRKTRALESWVDTNKSSGTSYALHGTTHVITDGTQRDLTEAMAKAAVQAAWTSGGDPEMMLTGPVNKQNVSSQFSGIATMYREQSGVGPGAIIGAADIYVSDFGELKVVPSRFSRDRTISIIQKDMWAVAYLRPFKVYDLAKTGDAEKRLLLSEYTLESRNEAASAKVADLNTSLL